MTAQIKSLTNTVATLSTQISAAAKGGGGGSGGGGSGGGGSGGGGGNKRIYKFTRNMGAYCYSCGHHPVGVNHTSVTCNRKHDDHNDLATADHRFGGSNFWPGPNKVKSSQQDHPKYKGKSANK
jgi:hypothetical protein